eukprot:5068227-Karenia_brevis.AAC.1
MQADLGAHLIAARTTNAGIRLLACGSVIRRLAAKAACHILKTQLRYAVGWDQYGVSRRAGCEL